MASGITLKSTNDSIVNIKNVGTTTGTTEVTVPNRTITMAGTDDVATAKSEAISAGLGVGQTWQDVTASRVAGTTYTNSTGKPIQVFVSFKENGAAGYFSVGNLSFVISGDQTNYATQTAFFIVPNGVTYSVSGSFYAYHHWAELR